MKPLEKIASAAPRSFPRALESLSAIPARFLSSSLPPPPSPTCLVARSTMPNSAQLSSVHVAGVYRKLFRRRRVRTRGVHYFQFRFADSKRSDVLACCTCCVWCDPRAHSNDRHATKLANPDKRDGVGSTDNLQFAKVDALPRSHCVLYDLTQLRWRQLASVKFATYILVSVKPRPNQQQCRSNVRLCRSNIRVCR